MPSKRKAATTQAPPAAKRAARAPPEIASYTPVLVDEDGCYKEVQRWTCVRARADEKCLSCVEKQAILGGCRFVGLRAFGAQPGYAFRGNTEDKEVVVVKEKEKKAPTGRRRRRRTRGAAEEEEESTEVEKKLLDADLRLDVTREMAEYALPIIAPTFAKHLERELRHETTNLAGTDVDKDARPLIRIKCSPLARSLCDFCATSIYMGSYMCGCCGREFCLGCYETWIPSAELYGGRLMRRDQCTKRRRHVKETMVFATRAKHGEIAAVLARVKARMTAIPRSSDIDEKIVAAIPTVTVPDCLPAPTDSWEAVSLSTFQALLRKGGIPLVLTGLRDRFTLPWNADYFTKHFGTEECILHSPSSDPILSTVASFFETFESPPATTNWKLKDWPPTASFSTTFPTLFTDFESALPFPTYTRRRGPLNLASHFPPAWNAPDLGPKMYNAYPSPNAATATTNLHLDLTDAVNIMLFSSHADGAVWDIFRPSSAAAIRAYLRPRNPAIDDPIHRQLYYLTDTDISALGPDVAPYRILQRPGDAVFIPAGCPHQVRNIGSCVKVAVDFLSPEGVGTCEGLVQEARDMAPKENAGGARERVKEDVLQLWSCLGFSWEVLEGVVLKGETVVEAEVKEEGGKLVEENGEKLEEKEQKPVEKANGEREVKGEADVRVR